MDKFTSFLKKRKAFVIVALIGIIAGFSLYHNPTQEDINKLKSEKTTILAKIDSSQEELSTLNKDIDDLQEKINQLNTEKQKQEEADRLAKADSISQSSSNNSSKNSNSNNSNSYSSNNPQPSKQVGEMVYITATGKKYHRKNKCGKTNPAKTSYIPLSEAESMGYSPCSKCY